MVLRAVRLVLAFATQLSYSSSKCKSLRNDNHNHDRGDNRQGQARAFGSPTSLSGQNGPERNE